MRGLPRPWGHAHVLFTTKSQLDQLEQSWKVMPRTTFQFHWTNQNWKDFEDYLSVLTLLPGNKSERAERRSRVRLGNRGQNRKRTFRSGMGVPYPLYRSTTRAKERFPFDGIALSAHPGTLCRASGRLSCIGWISADGGLYFLSERATFVWTVLGMPRSRRVPAFRTLLLPTHRVGDRQGAYPV